MSSKSFKSLSEVQDFVEIAWSKIPIETLENTINGMSNRIGRKEHRKVNISIIKLGFNDALN